MILQALVKLAENEKLIADPDFEYRAVAWIVRLNDDGSVLGIEDNRLNLNEGKVDKKGRPIKPQLVGKDALIPLFPNGRAGIKPKAAFLVDMAKFVFGLEPQAETQDGSLTPYVQRFRELIVDCETATADSAVGSVRKMLDRVLAGEKVAPMPSEVGPSDLFMFRVGDDGPVQNRENVKTYWRERRASVPTDIDSTNRTTCLVTGVTIVGKPSLFPLIKNVPGAGTMGSGLVAMNGPSARTWWSYGLEGNENAPVARLAAEAAAVALNRLADPRPTNGTGESLPVRRIRLSSDTIVVFWSSEASPEIQSVLDTMPNLVDPVTATEEVGNLIGSYRTGNFHRLKDPAKFYAMTLTGTTGRIVVKDWFESTVADIQSNIKAYFDDLSIIRPAGTSQSAELDYSTLPSLRDIKLAAYRELDDVPPPFGRNWLRIMWSGRNARVPPNVAEKVIRRIQIALAHGDDPAHHAYSVLKLFVLREGENDMKAYVNEDHSSAAYHCGRLLAILDFAQQRALGTTNTSNVRRMLGAIMTAPALYLGRIRKLTEIAYLPKMDGDWAGFLKDRLQSVSGTIGDEIPRILQMREQSIFFLGFDQERTFLQTHPPSKYKWQTSIGLWVMSRGERNVVESLVKLGFGKDFLYEPGLKTEGVRSRLPDFMIPGQLTSDQIFIEYLGMLDKPEYVTRWNEKLREYEAMGLLPLESGGGNAGKLIVLDHVRHPDEASIFNELNKHLGMPLAADENIQPEGESK